MNNAGLRACGQLPTLAATGADYPIVVVLAVVLALVIVGVIAVGIGRRGRPVRAIATVVLLLGLGVGLGVAPTATAQAQVVQCVDTAALTIVQTSTLTGLAPGGSPLAISGRSTNLSAQSVVVTAIVVTVAGVTIAPGADAGSCLTSNYVITGARMPVGVTLVPGGSVAFSGAGIQLVDFARNQDACKGTAVLLRYETAS